MPAAHGEGGKVKCANPKLHAKFLCVLEKIQHCRYVVIGSVAMLAYSPLDGRAIGDLDIVVEPGETPVVHSALKQCGFVKQDVTEGPSGAYEWFKTELQGRLALDVHIVQNSLKVFDREGHLVEFLYPLGRSISSPTHWEIGGIRLKMARKEDLVIMKMLPIFADERNKKHYEDLTLLLRLPGGLDMDYLCEIVSSNTGVRKRVVANQQEIATLMPSVLSLLNEDTRQSAQR